MTKPKLVDRQELARVFLVTPMTITRWERDGMPVAKKRPRGQSSLFDPAAVEQWKNAKDTEALEDPERLSLEIERAKYTQRQREKLELEMAVRRGELVLRDQVQREGVIFVKGLQAKLRGIPRRAVQVGAVTPEKLPMLEVLMREVLLELARWKTSADTTKVHPPSKAKKKRAS